jgi:acyl-[acyl-carrier-protein]-phospholipid O-acyltransferase/long-chain-fatty-acid--[acyl-carrier-protein] ligase
MVPHIEIEEKLAEIIGVPEEDGLKAAVTAIADERKGERLVVLYTDVAVTPAQMRERLMESGMPNLYVPSADSFRRVDHLPMLGSGKLDLKQIKKMAEEAFRAE